MNRFPEQHRNAKIRRARDVSALSRLALLLFCGLVLTGGFVFAAKQHFAAVQYGYKNEKLRSERKRLMEERQLLSLEKETISSPAKLAPAARALGLKPATAAQIAPLQAKSADEARDETKLDEKRSSSTSR
jgi:cell division protein FtsL